MVAQRETTSRHLTFLVIAICVLYSGAAWGEESGWLSSLTAEGDRTELTIAQGGEPAYTDLGTPEENPFGLGVWWTFAANLDASYRKTQFFKSDYDSTVFQWDSRLQFWLPPSYKVFSWGPYVRVAGITSNHSSAWENAWLARPGAGFQVYPLSSSALTEDHELFASILGPLRLFAEYNCLHYWGDENNWRPQEQLRAGLEYWKAVNVNDTRKAIWAELWAGLTWQSANEFDDEYDSVILGNAARIGVRLPKAGIVSWFTPYIALESSLTDNSDYYWENRLLLGGGVRFSPPLQKLSPRWRQVLSRIVVFAEYLDATAHYRSSPSSGPDHDFRVGVSVSIGEWYK